MMKKTVGLMIVVCLVIAAGVAVATTAETKASVATKGVMNSHLLERGDAQPITPPAAKGTQGDRANDTLMLNATNGPGATNATTYLWWTGSAVAFMGNYFGPGADFPTSWYPFDITGVFAWHWVTGSGHPSATWLIGAMIPDGYQTGTHNSPPWQVTTAIIGNGVSTGVVGFAGLWGAGSLPVTAGGCACGIRTYGSDMGMGQDGVGMNPGSGNGHWAYMGTTGFYTANWFRRDGQWSSYSGIAGCYVSGANVPVELMNIDVE